MFGFALHAGGNIHTDTAGTSIERWDRVRNPFRDSTRLITCVASAYMPSDAASRLDFATDDSLCAPFLPLDRQRPTSADVGELRVQVIHQPDTKSRRAG